jgi:hypothetical protein
MNRDPYPVFGEHQNTVRFIIVILLAVLFYIFRNES